MTPFQNLLATYKSFCRRWNLPSIFCFHNDSKIRRACQYGGIPQQRDKRLPPGRLYFAPFPRVDVDTEEAPSDPIDGAEKLPRGAYTKAIDILEKHHRERVELKTHKKEF